ncbi:UNKNOWN [Stylonychia lemnae]|uniref:Uncharacterized protein n=1 Tax=Stylonychia lemnae TaxID=5949 RepID=A0A078AQP4_STYLE|nr:UNKNOWN [Stylonychia lemnae]|eukprot:CDW84524.1 UNKNOWN [Stylonychia lemnae]
MIVGEVIIDSRGELTSTLPLENEDLTQVSQIISNILQDINTYMKLNNNSTGDLKKTTLRIGNSHEISIAVGSDAIKAVVREVNSGGQGM